MGESCPEENELVAFASGQLSPDARARLEQHFDTCSSCQLILVGMLDPTSPATAPRARAEPLTRGTSLGRYLILERIGAGGMGVVYSAYDPELDRRVALKLVRVTVSDERWVTQASQRLQKEARTMAQLSHPHVATVYDVGTFGQQVFVAMEWASGGSLRQWLADGQRTWREILDVFLQAGEGLGAAHDAGWIHRDFKPENVLLGDGGRVMVTDFGLARALAAAQGDSAPLARPAPAPSPLTLTREGAIVGTPAYMAPEQRWGGAVDARADQFSFCAALYEALCGVRPFAAPSEDEALRQMRAGALAEPKPGTDAPAWLRRALARGLSFEPSARYPSMRALLEVLARDPAARRRRALLVAGAAAVVLAVLGTVARAEYRERTRCAREVAQLTAFWTPALQERLRAALTSPSDGGWSERLAGMLGAHVADARAARQQVCEGARVGDISAATAELRRHCLDDQLERVRQLSELLLQQRDGMGERAARVIGTMPPIKACLGRTFEPPEGPAPEPALARELIRADLLIGLEQVDAAEALLQRIVADAHRTSARSVESEARLLRAQLLFDRQEHADEAAAELRESARLAEAAGEHSKEALARVGLVKLLGWLNRYPEAEEAARDARASLARAGGHQPAEAMLNRDLGIIALQQGRGEARALMERALDVARQVYGDNSPGLIWYYNDLGRAVAESGDLPLAAGHFERAAELTRSFYWPGHPWLFSMEFNIATTWALAGRSQEALASLERIRPAAEAREKSAPDELADLLLLRAELLTSAGRSAEAQVDIERAEKLLAHRDVPSSTRTSLAVEAARVALATGRLDEARRRAEQAVALASERPGEVEALARARFALARALGRAEPRARKLAEDALATFRAGMYPVDAEEAREVEAWLAR